MLSQVSLGHEVKYIQSLYSYYNEATIYVHGSYKALISSSMYKFPYKHKYEKNIYRSLYIYIYSCVILLYYISLTPPSQTHGGIRLEFDVKIVSQPQATTKDLSIERRG